MLLLLLFPNKELLLVLLFANEKLLGLAFEVTVVLNKPPLLLFVLLLPKRLLEVEPNTVLFCWFPKSPPWVFPKIPVPPPPNKLFFCGVVGAAPKVLLPNKDIYFKYNYFLFDLYIK